MNYTKLPEINRKSQVVWTNIVKAGAKVTANGEHIRPTKGDLFYPRK